MLLELVENLNRLLAEAEEHDDTYEILDLSGLFTLSEEEVEVLSNYKGHYLYLNGLRILSDGAAKALENFVRRDLSRGDYPARLYLNGITSLSAGLAHLVCEFQGTEDFSDNTISLVEIDYSKLTSLSREAADCFYSFKGTLELNGLSELSDGIAQALGNHKGHLSLNGLSRLSDEAAKALGQHKGGIELNGLTDISYEAAKAFACLEGMLSLLGITQLSDDKIRALTGLETRREDGDIAYFKSDFGYKCTLQLGLNSPLSKEAAEAFGQYKGMVLNLPNVESLSPEAARALANFSGRLHLPALDPNLPRENTVSYYRKG